MSSKRDKKDEEAGATNPFANLDKTSLLQEARAFNETPINSRKCIHILTKLLYLLGQGEQLGRTEATEAFFAVTKLWQSSDATLRRLVYIAVKELSTMADDVIIVTSSLTKDMTGREDQYRASAIRALCKITDPAMLQAIERYMKQAIVDKSPAVASAALVSALHLMKRAPDVVKRWMNEVQEAVNSDNNMVQYHALCLLYHIRKTDRLAVNKLVQKFSKQGLKSPYAICFLIRLSAKLIEESESGGGDAYMFDFVESCLRHKSEMVVYEAANALTRLPSVTAKELAPAVSVLQLLCGSTRPAQRFAAVRTLSKISIAHPAAVASCNMDLEQLITDSNRSIATLAITTLLKTGAEASVERLMKQISSFVTEIPDEFKIVVIQAIRSLCVRYPRKHAVMMNFLATMLRDDGGYEYKKSIVDTIISIIEENGEAREAGLSHLCEFIEDCEHAVLAVRVLQLLGTEAPKTAQPRRYIRFIYNRVILEQAQVRAAAVTALARLGAGSAALSPSVCVLLARCLTDEDDEVRDRATYYLSVLSDGDAADKMNYILGGLQYSVVGLERALQHYCNTAPHAEPFDLRSVPVADKPLTVADGRPPPPAVAEPAETRPKKSREPAATAGATRADLFAQQLSAVPAIASLNAGALFRSSEPVELTEAETEYCVHCVKHTFAGHIVLQFDVGNTLTDQLLEDVRVELTPAEGADAWRVLADVPAAGALLPAQKVTAYCALLIPDVVEEQTGTLNAVLKFVVKDCDPNTFEPDSEEGFDDEYQLEDVEIGVSEHMQRSAKANFDAAWAAMGDDPGLTQTDDTYALSTVNTVQEAVSNVVSLFGLSVCERSDRVPEGKCAHVLLLSGKHRAGGDELLVRAKFALDPATGAVAMNMAVRSTSEEAVQLVASVFG